MRIQPKNWKKFQHYSHRNPPWIKLQKQLLDDYDFACLSDASKWLAMRLWLLASEYQDGMIDASEQQITFRLRLSINEFKTMLNELQTLGFFDVFQDASKTLAPQLHDATTETELSKEKIYAECDSALQPDDLFPAKEPLPKKDQFSKSETFQKYIDWCWCLYALEDGRGRNGNKKKTVERLSKTIKNENEVLMFALSVNEYLRQVDSENHGKQDDKKRALKLPEVFAGEWQGYIPFDADERIQAHKAKKAGEANVSH